MKVLVTGGAGYIGSVMTKMLLDRGNSVVVADSLEKGYESAIDKRATFLKGDLKDGIFVEKLFSENKFDAVMHFAAYISVEESMREPIRYFHNNISVVLSILEAMRKYHVDKLIFSSTAAVYGNPLQTPIPEGHPTIPTSVYGESKLAAERIIHWYNKIFGFHFVILRYFNASGATLDNSLGERHIPETHIIPNAIQAVLEKKPFILHGTDYGTPDGTCIRDYIHVTDLAESHLLALNKLDAKGGAYLYNVGAGKGYSNREVIDTVKKISGVDFAIEESKPRPGDPAILIANPQNIKTELGFIPKYSDLETIVKTAWKWHLKISNLKPASPAGGSQISK